MQVVRDIVDYALAQIAHVSDRHQQRGAADEYRDTDLNICSEDFCNTEQVVH